MNEPAPKPSKIIDFTTKHQYFVLGKDIKTAVINKDNILRKNMGILLDQLKTIPQDEEDVAVLIMSLYKPNITDSRVLLAKGLAEGAAKLHSEIEALATSSRNLRDDMHYVLSTEDITWYGL